MAIEILKVPKEQSINKVTQRKTMSKKVVIAYHKNCMDGVSSAYLAYKELAKRMNVWSDIILQPLQYGQESELYKNPINKETTVIFVDFSLKRDALIELADKVCAIEIFDHHKTAETELVNLPENVSCVFNMEQSGAMICYDEFDHGVGNRDLFEYIQDRDLWTWELPHSKEVSAYLSLMVTPNDIHSFGKVCQDFDLDDAVGAGMLLVKQQEIQVNSKLYKTTNRQVKGIDFAVINVAENISELGNAICQTFDRPALMYFITEDMKVICSLRSTDHLPDVSVVATSFGGGGHRNACGFTITLAELQELLAQG